MAVLYLGRNDNQCPTTSATTTAVFIHCHHSTCNMDTCNCYGPFALNAEHGGADTRAYMHIAWMSSLFQMVHYVPAACCRHTYVDPHVLWRSSLFSMSSVTMDKRVSVQIRACPRGHVCIHVLCEHALTWSYAAKSNTIIEIHLPE